MDTRLFLSTFALIFLAELGDKTQLTTLARAASEKAPWSVFLGASLALVTSTVLAVLFGSALRKVAPPQVIKGMAGALFLVFGAILLASALRARPPVEPAKAEPFPAASRGMVASLALDTALAFEEASAEHYAQMARREDEAELQALWKWLADEEQEHVQKVRTLAESPEQPAVEEAPATEVRDLSLSASDAVRDKLAEAIRHERVTADFYEALSRASHLPSMKRVLLALAVDERQHAARLEELAKAAS